MQLHAANRAALTAPEAIAHPGPGACVAARFGLCRRTRAC